MRDMKYLTGFYVGSKNVRITNQIQLFQHVSCQINRFLRELFNRDIVSLWIKIME